VAEVIPKGSREGGAFRVLRPARKRCEKEKMAGDYWTSSTRFDCPYARECGRRRPNGMRLTVIVLGTEPRAGSWSRVSIFFKGIAPQFDFRNVHGSDGLPANTSGPQALADSIREVCR